MKIRLLIFLLLFEPLVTVGFAFGTYPADVEIVLNKSGKNRPELEKAIRYFQQKKDPLKLKAIYFLITNMDIHYSSNYRWVDASNKEIPFNEFKYPNYKAAKLELAELKRICPTMHPTYSKTSDVSSITGDFLIDNVERAFRVWRNSPIKNISFNNFCEYILPYRVSNEPLQSWRGIYQNKFQWVNGKIKEKIFIKGDKVIPDPNLVKLNQLMDKSNQSNKEGDTKAAIKYCSKAIELDSTFADAYFARGTIKLNDFKFDDAIADFDKALKLEPYMDVALANRAFARIRKYQFANSRTLSKNDDVTVLASADKVPIATDDQEKICSDLQEAVFLGDKSKMITEALSNYCQTKSSR